MDAFCNMLSLLYTSAAGGDLPGRTSGHVLASSCRVAVPAAAYLLVD